MSSAGRAGSSSGCVTRPKGRETGLHGFAVQIQLCSLIGSYVMATAEQREPYESRGSRTVLGEPGGEIPPRDSTGTPQVIVELLNHRIGEVVSSADYRALIEKSGSVAVSSTPQELQQLILDTANDAAPIIQEFGVQLD